MTEIIIADDHALVRSGLSALLAAEADLAVVGEAIDGRQALEMTLRLEPCVLITDVNMPYANGIEVARALRSAGSHVRVLLLSMHEDPGLLREALAAGASGYVTKRGALADLVSAVRTVVAGDTYIDPILQRSERETLMRNAQVAVPGLESLTGEEVELLRLIARGYLARQIADELGLDPTTTQRLKSALCDKLGLATRAELLRYAREQKLLP